MWWSDHFLTIVRSAFIVCVIRVKCARYAAFKPSIYLRALPEAEPEPEGSWKHPTGVLNQLTSNYLCISTHDIFDYFMMKAFFKYKDTIMAKMVYYSNAYNKPQ